MAAKVVEPLSVAKWGTGLSLGEQEWGTDLGVKPRARALAARADVMPQHSSAAQAPTPGARQQRQCTYQPRTTASE